MFADQGPVAQRLVSANRWLRGIKTYRFPWYLTLVSANHASSNPGQVFIDPTFSGIFVCGPLQSFVVNVCTIFH